jgi:hypothetical protein
VKFLSKLSKGTLVCSELQLKFYKDLLKCTYGDTPDSLIFIETICDVFSSIANKPSEFFKKLSIIDFFCLLLDMRINSQGDACSVIITKDNKKMNLELRLDYIRDDLKAGVGLLASSIEQDNITIIIDYPSVDRMLEPASAEYLRYIKGVYVLKSSLLNEETKCFVEISTNEHAEMFFDKLSPKTSLRIIEQFDKIFKFTTDINFLARYGIKDQHLTFFPTLESLLWFAKLMFNEPLDVLYNNIFYLAQMGNMSADYIENAIVGEYNFFVGCLKQKIAADNPAPENNSYNISPEDVGLTDDLL